MVRARLCFEDGQAAIVELAARPLVDEFIIHGDDRYRVKDVYHKTAPAEAAEEAMLVVKLGIGRKGSHRHMLELSPRGFFTGSD